MGRIVVADENLREYIEKLAAPNTCTVGLMLGQPAQNKDYVIHFAKTPPLQREDADNDTPRQSTVEATPFKDMSEVIDFWIADHAKHATRMLPGGMYVIGVFIVSDEDVVPKYDKKIRSIVLKMQAQLTSCPFLFASPNNSEKIVLNYILKRKDYECFSVDTTTGLIKGAEFKYLPKTTKWHQLECKYELNEIFPIPIDCSDWDLKKHMQIIVDGINSSLQHAVFLFDGDIKNGNEHLESIGKKKKIGIKVGLKPKADEVVCTQISIYIPCESHDQQPSINIKSCAGHIKVFGQISCKLWLHPKVSLDHAKQCIVQDLIRSLTARLEMHWDSLIEEEHGSPEDTNSIHEPPRRVMIPLPNNIITLSDYLFPGEGASEAMISLQELLDIKVAKKEDILEVEGQADLAELYPPSITSVSEVDSEEIMQDLSQKTNKFIYLVGLGVAVVVLIVSLLINYIQSR